MVDRIFKMFLACKRLAYILMRILTGIIHHVNANTMYSIDELICWIHIDRVWSHCCAPFHLSIECSCMLYAKQLTRYKPSTRTQSAKYPFECH